MSGSRYIEGGKHSKQKEQKMQRPWGWSVPDVFKKKKYECSEVSKGTSTRNKMWICVYVHMHTNHSSDNNHPGLVQTPQVKGYFLQQDYPHFRCQCHVWESPGYPHFWPTGYKFKGSPHGPLRFDTLIKKKKKPHRLRKVPYLVIILLWRIKVRANQPKTYIRRGLRVYQVWSFHFLYLGNQAFTLSPTRNFPSVSRVFIRVSLLNHGLCDWTNSLSAFFLSLEVSRSA